MGGGGFLRIFLGVMRFLSENGGFAGIWLKIGGGSPVGRYFYWKSRSLEGVLGEVFYGKAGSFGEGDGERGR